jgi:hypothetical protein
MIQSHFGSMKAWELTKRNIVFRYSNVARSLMDENDPARDRLMMGMGGVRRWEGEGENRKAYVEVAVVPLHWDGKRKLWYRDVKSDSPEHWCIKRFYVSGKPLQAEIFDDVSVQVVQRNRDGDLLMLRDISMPKPQLATAG